MNFTVTKRQTKLYADRGFDLPTWEALVDEGNRLRREIKLIAEEYDVEWSEKEDAGDEKVTEALRQDRKKKDMEDDEDGGDKKKKDKDDD